MTSLKQKHIYTATGKPNLGLLLVSFAFAFLCRRVWFGFVCTSFPALLVACVVGDHRETCEVWFLPFVGAELGS